MTAEMGDPNASSEPNHEVAKWHKTVAPLRLKLGKSAEIALPTSHEPKPYICHIYIYVIYMSYIYMIYIHHEIQQKRLEKSLRDWTSNMQLVEMKLN